MQLNGDSFYDEGFSSDDSNYRRAARKHPSPEQTLFRMAVEKALMNRERTIWNLWNFDRLTETEIAAKLRTSTPSISRTLKRIEARLVKWCNEHKAVYEALKEAEDMRDHNGRF